MHQKRPREALDPAVEAAVIEFLRDWLPDGAKEEYRRMIEADPEHWSEHPHFAGGIIRDFALRGNGITEKTLGIRDLDAVWPELLRQAVIEPPEEAGGAVAKSSHG